MFKPNLPTRPYHYIPSLCVTAALLKKVSAHLLVLACLMIVGEGTGRFTIGQFNIFLVIALATLIHIAGGALQRRLSARLAFPQARS